MLSQDLNSAQEGFARFASSARIFKLRAGPQFDLIFSRIRGVRLARALMLLQLLHQFFVRSPCELCEKLVQPGRLELPTPWSEAKCSIQLSYGCMLGFARPRSMPQFFWASSFFLAAVGAPWSLFFVFDQIFCGQGIVGICGRLNFW